jgi:hypothetical protein
METKTPVKETSYANYKARRKRIALGFIAVLSVAYAGGAYAFICYMTSDSGRFKTAQVKVTKNSPLVRNKDSEAVDEISPEVYVKEVLAREQELLNDWEYRRSQALPEPKERRAYSRWCSRVEELEQEIAKFTEFPEGSVQWELKNELERLNQDVPSR